MIIALSILLAASMLLAMVGSTLWIAATIDGDLMHLPKWVTIWAGLIFTASGLLGMVVCTVLLLKEILL